MVGISGFAVRENGDVTADDPLEREVYVGGEYRPFGDLTAEDARTLAATLRGISGGGLDAKVGPVRMGWTELAKRLDAEGGTVSGLPAEDVAKFAERLWVTPPGGTLLP
jgi:hypothetical protein